MARIFVSYSSKDRDKVNSLADDLKELGHEVWIDRELGGTGGQKWWANILEQIRQCQVFIFALTPASLGSDPCRSEYRYAYALQKPIIPVMLDTVDIPSLPVELQEIQFIDFRESNRKQAINLASSLNKLPPARPMPDPLPAEPPTPLSPTARISQQLDAESLSPGEQIELLFELELLLNDPMTRVTATNLLNRLNNRPDVTAKVTEKIKSLGIKPAQSAKRGIAFSAAARRFQLTCSVIVATIMVGFVGMYVMRNGSAATLNSADMTGTAMTYLNPTSTHNVSLTNVSDAPTNTPQPTNTPMPPTILPTIKPIGTNPSKLTISGFTVKQPPGAVIDASNAQNIIILGEAKVDGQIAALAWSADGKTVAIAGDKLVWFQNGQNLTVAPTEFVQFNNPVIGLSFTSASAKTRRLAIGTNGQRVLIWDAQSRKFTAALGIEGTTYNVAFGLVSDRLLTQDFASNVELWSLAQNPPVVNKTWPQRGNVFNIAFSPDGKYAALAAKAETHIWTILEGSEAVPVLTGIHSAPVDRVAFSPDSHLLASGGQDSLIQLWSIPSGAPTIGLKDLEGNIAGLIFSPQPSSKVLVASNLSGEFFVWDTDTGKLLVKILAHKGGTTQLVFSPDGKLILTGSDDGYLRLWGIP